LGARSKEVRALAQAALQHIICHEAEHDAVDGDADERARAVAAWQTLWDTHRQRTWADWVHEGIASAGYELREDLHDTECIETLIEATGDKRDHIFQNAVRLLGVVTGHVVDPSSRSAKRHHLYWRRWWERQQANTDGAN
jgi:hypothetical protein